jgi:hypothetical protein
MFSRAVLESKPSIAGYLRWNQILPLQGKVISTGICPSGKRPKL